MADSLLSQMQTFLEIWVECDGKFQRFTSLNCHQLCNILSQEYIEHQVTVNSAIFLQLIHTLWSYSDSQESQATDCLIDG
ncbi:hypothetical protein NIES4101_43080 [Calothrix sp. NIES-4101]|nr:hypothetical protein NIES4101_43080 [Calothrix sp. NIES-4101]